MLIGKIEEKILEDLIPKEELRVALKTLESKKELLKELDHRVYVDKCILLYGTGMHVTLWGLCNYDIMVTSLY